MTIQTHTSLMASTCPLLFLTFLSFLKKYLQKIKRKHEFDPWCHAFQKSEIMQLINELIETSINFISFKRAMQQLATTQDTKQH